MIYVLDGSVNIQGKFAVHATSYQEAVDKCETFFLNLNPDDSDFKSRIIFEIDGVTLNTNN
ncbi:MAG: hypothetical protein GF317_19260 [Candidatus Lokiarchaeota archaeon]|nr:hypothetical protein [Candidatus Lokiarchaeota archaeon]